jgi:hypothetical protein
LVCKKKDGLWLNKDIMFERIVHFIGS